MKEERFEAYNLEDYPDIDAIAFPEEIYVAYAVCGKECGRKEFIVDGQTQVCQSCGKLMFRAFVQKFVRGANVATDG